MNGEKDRWMDRYTDRNYAARQMNRQTDGQIRHGQTDRGTGLGMVWYRGSLLLFNTIQSMIQVLQDLKTN